MRDFPEALHGSSRGMVRLSADTLGSNRAAGPHRHRDSSGIDQLYASMRSMSRATGGCSGDCCRGDSCQCNVPMRRAAGMRVELTTDEPVDWSRRNGTGHDPNLSAMGDRFRGGPGPARSGPELQRRRDSTQAVTFFGRLSRQVRPLARILDHVLAATERRSL